MIIIPSADITMFVQLEHNDLEVILERNGRLGSWNHFRTPTESIARGKRELCPRKRIFNYCNCLFLFSVLTIYWKEPVFRKSANHSIG